MARTRSPRALYELAEAVALMVFIATLVIIFGLIQY
jgi:hypothetical protein